jgi:DNA-binding transcriptional MerR regulator
VDKKIIKNTFTIEEVSEVAGVNSFTLRNWEDRYSLFTPGRDANGRRIFSESDTIRAVVAAELTKRHYKISKVAADLQASADPHLVLADAVEGESFVELRKEAFQALLEFNVDVYQQSFMHLLGNYDIEFIADHFFYPTYRELEVMKLNHKITPFQFRFIQHHLAARIFRLTGALKVSRHRDITGKVLVTGLPENEFEDSTLILYLVLERYGWQVIYGGPRTQMSELQDAVTATGADLVILVGNNLTLHQYEKSASTLESLSVPVVVGGRLAIKLLAEDKKSTPQVELTPLRPGPFARLLKFKLASPSSSDLL